jgi:hypothetical protein
MKPADDIMDIGARLIFFWPASTKAPTCRTGVILRS